MTIYAVELVARVPGSSELVVRQLGTVTAAGFVQAKRTARQRWARTIRDGETWLRVGQGLRERESGPGRRSGHGGL